MHGMMIFLLWLLAIALGSMMLIQGLQRKVDFFSIRNLYLTGFIVYCIHSVILPLSQESFYGFPISDPVRTAKWYVFFTYVYVAVYLFCYHRVRLVHWLGAKLSPAPSIASDSSLLMFALGLTALAVPLRIVALYVPVAAGALLIVSIALAAISSATAGWVWGHRRFNPAVLAFVLVILAGCLFVSLYHTYSRRPLLGILFGFSWGVYYRWARYLPLTRLFTWMAPLFLVAVTILAAYTAIRRGAHTGSVDQTVQQMAQADVRQGTESIISGQAVGAGALWAVDKFPKTFPMRHLESLKVMLCYYVPRQWWPDKPISLSLDVARLARLKGVNQDTIKLPIGVVGFAAAEGGFYALLIYALFFGQFTRFFDELVQRNLINPFIILPAGCVTGQFLGLARGDIAIFTSIIIVSIVSALLLMQIVRKMIGQRIFTPYWTQMPQPG